MKIGRAILTGGLVWALVISAFTALTFVPGVKDSEIQQGLVIGILIIPFASLGASFYYRKGDRTNGFNIGLVMVASALLLDVTITVPLVEIPYNEGSYSAFFTNPLLWILVAENIAVIYFYWRLKVKPNPSH